MSEAKTADLSALKINRNHTTPRPEGDGQTTSRRWWYLGGIVIMTIIAVILYVQRDSFSVEEIETATVLKISPNQANSVLTASGYVVAQRKAAISSKITGRLIQLNNVEGDKVKTGHIIARIESAELEASQAQMRAALDMAKADVDNARVEVDDAKIELDRKQQLVAEKAISQSEYDASKARYNKANATWAARRAAIAVAEANLRNAQVQLENSFVRAPFDGTVLTKNANVGEVITALGGAAGSRGAIVTLADMSSLEVETDVSESNIERVQVNQPCEITLDAFPEKRYKGFVGKIIPTADRAKATVMMKIKFSDLDESVIPEMSAKVSFLNLETQTPAVETPSTPKIMIPASAVVTRDGKKVVFRVSGENVMQLIIQTGNVTGTMIEVTQGLQGGEKIVIRPSDKLRDGSKIAIKK